MKRTSLIRGCQRFGMSALVGGSFLLSGGAFAKGLVIDFTGNRAESTFKNGFPDVQPIGPLELEGYLVSMKQKEITGLLSCTEKIKVETNAEDNKPIFRCVLKIPEKVLDIPAEQPVTPQ